MDGKQTVAILKYSLNMLHSAFLLIIAGSVRRDCEFGQGVNDQPVVLLGRAWHYQDGVIMNFIANLDLVLQRIMMVMFRL